MSIKPASFETFYNKVFLAEHHRPANIALHVAGTLMGLAWLLASFLWSTPLAALAFPVVHALPGLIGHRMFERNRTVGDVRITRKDYSPLWFIAANHRMTAELLFKGFYWRDATASGKP